ncbi:hypothetical protein KTR9_0836 [Gordonia sp. KTR9]|nr:hypothetical protein KTR9_0836 [Gordonia sp. KTR9]
MRDDDLDHDDHGRHQRDRAGTEHRSAAELLVVEPVDDEDRAADAQQDHDLRDELGGTGFDPADQAEQQDRAGQERRGQDRHRVAEMAQHLRSRRLDRAVGHPAGDRLGEDVCDEGRRGGAGEDRDTDEVVLDVQRDEYREDQDVAVDVGADPRRGVLALEGAVAAEQWSVQQGPRTIAHG